MVLDLKIAPSGQTIVKPTALGQVANTDTKLLIYGLFQKGRVLAQDGYADHTFRHPHFQVESVQVNDRVDLRVADQEL